MSGLIRWPWRKHEIDPRELEDARRAVTEADVWQARARRVGVATERAIVQNHFAHDVKRALGGDK